MSGPTILKRSWPIDGRLPVQAEVVPAEGWFRIRAAGRWTSAASAEEIDALAAQADQVLRRRCRAGDELRVAHAQAIRWCAEAIKEARQCPTT